jgi:hypothetical protein
VPAILIEGVEITDNTVALLAPEITLIAEVLTTPLDPDKNIPVEFTVVLPAVITLAVNVLFDSKVVTCN